MWFHLAYQYDVMFTLYPFFVLMVLERIIIHLFEFKLMTQFVLLFGSEVLRIEFLIIIFIRLIAVSVDMLRIVGFVLMLLESGSDLLISEMHC